MLLAFGRNSRGELGLGKIDAKHNVSQCMPVVLGGWAACSLVYGGCLCVGFRAEMGEQKHIHERIQELGRRCNRPHAVAIKLKQGHSIRSIACGHFHSACVAGVCP